VDLEVSGLVFGILGYICIYIYTLIQTYMYTYVYTCIYVHTCACIQVVHHEHTVATIRLSYLIVLTSIISPTADDNKI